MSFKSTDRVDILRDKLNGLQTLGDFMERVGRNRAVSRNANGGEHGSDVNTDDVHEVMVETARLDSGSQALLV